MSKICLAPFIILFEIHLTLFSIYFFIYGCLHHVRQHTKRLDLSFHICSVLPDVYAPEKQEKSGISQNSFWNETICLISCNMLWLSKASTQLTTQTACSHISTTALMELLESWPMPSFPRLGKSILMMMSTGYWVTCGSAGRRVSRTIKKQSGVNQSISLLFEDAECSGLV